MVKVGVNGFGRIGRNVVRAALGKGSIDDRLSAIESVANDWMSYEGGCTYDNRWCDAPEMVYAEGPGCSCRTGPSSMELFLIVGAALAIRLRPRRRRRS